MSYEYNRVISWNTSVDNDGFVWKVYSFEYGKGPTVHEHGRCQTRAQATGAAKRASRKHKAIQASQS